MLRALCVEALTATEHTDPTLRSMDASEHTHDSEGV